MRIAQISPLTEAVPPKLYGGTERVISWLTEELVALGHDVALFASGNSVTSARLEPMWPTALQLDGSVRDPNALHISMIEQVARRAKEFDLLHFHLDYYPFSVMSRQSTPFLTTLHGRLDLPEHEPVFSTFPTVPVVSISNAQRRPAPRAHWISAVYHGMPEGLLRPAPFEPSYLAFFGLIWPEKRVDRAINIAERYGLPLKIAAKVDPTDHDYFEEMIRPLLGQTARRIHWRGLGRAEARIPKRRPCAYCADRLAGAVRIGHDRGDGLRGAGRRLQSRLGLGGDRRWGDRIVVEDERAPLAPSVISRDCRGLRSESALRSVYGAPHGERLSGGVPGFLGVTAPRHESPQSPADLSSLGRVSGIASPAAARPRSPNPAIIRKAVGLSKRSLTYPASVVLIDAPTLTRNRPRPAPD